MTTDTLEFEAGVWDVDNSAYHADRTAVSNSALSVFIESVPLYFGRYISGNIPAPEPTEAMRLGTCFETLLLEPERCSEVFVVAPPDLNRRTNAGKWQWQEMQDSGKIVIKQADLDQLNAMAASVRANEEAHVLLETTGQAQLALRWEDGATGIRLKAKFDKWIPFDGGGIILDVKSCDDPSPEGFGRSAAAYNYHLQCELYCQGAEKALGVRASFLFLAVGKNPPYESIIYTLGTDERRLAQVEISKYLDQLAERRRSGDWSSRWAGEQILKFPRYKFFQGGLS